MTRPDLARWNARFDTDDYLFGEAPNAFLRTQAAALAPGRALCVADGEGRSGVWLAEQGWEVVSLDFSDVAQRKAAALAARRGVSLDLVLADVHAWDYPPAAFDLVVDIFSQFSTPADRLLKWDGMVRALKPGGWLVLQGYTPDQLRHRTGGPSDPTHLYTEDLLRSAFAMLDQPRIIEEELTLHEGAGHRGMSAVIGLAARRGL
ncbi:class I SAM-dependent methyltransferase [Tabrizicola sp.]|uniref:class I SAM-dependent methyltransferase n=1 Tax=Tabrizicola sp. TaxID=2005166 RepID=UPI00260EABE7|nr:class I SAM-dependent methyltransferase [Tabrizicola sp.]MDM7931479.1 class I SAM-dependent methyltransferase [Tabrizicola sp.]